MADNRLLAAPVGSAAHEFAELTGRVAILEQEVQAKQEELHQLRDAIHARRLLLLENVSRDRPVVVYEIGSGRCVVADGNNVSVVEIISTVEVLKP